MCLTGLKRTNINSSIRLEVVSKLPMKRSLVDAMRMMENIKAWFSLAHKHKDTSSPQPDNKADEASTIA